MSDTTKEQLLKAATALFAEKGFYGASLANIADELQLTKQALLHHFGRKEQLYAQVMQRISEATIGCILEAIEADTPVAEKFENAVLALYQNTLKDADSTQLLMRELLDNKQRASQVRNWHLKPLLENFIALSAQLPSRKQHSRSRNLAGVYQLIGAINYFAISRPTLSQMFGEEEYLAMQKSYPDELKRLIQQHINGE